MRIKAFLIVAAAGCLSAGAQYDPAYTHYWMMEPSFNAGAAGKDDMLNITAVYSMQMTGFSNAPKTMYAAADMPLIILRRRHGIGLLFQNDEAGLFSHKRFSAQYAFHVEKLFGGKLGIGVQADLISEQFDGSKADVEDANDPAIPASKVNGAKVDMSAGVHYRHRNWYAGFSVAHILAPTVTLGETNKEDISRTYYLTGEYNIRLRNPFISIHPSTLCMYDGSDLRASVGGRVEFSRERKSLFAGAAWTPEHSAAAYIGGLFHGINLSYSYEAYTSVPGLRSGAHEIILKYQMNLNLYKKGRNRHKSVRFL